MASDGARRVGEEITVPRSLGTLAAYGWRFLVVAAAAVVIGYIIITLRLIVLPVFVALLISTLLVPPARWLRKRGVPALIATWLVLLAVFALFGGLAYLVGPQIASELDNIVSSARTGAEDVIAWLTQGPLDLTREEVHNYGDRIAEEFRGRQGSLVSGAFRGAYLVIEVITGLLLTLVLTFFIVKDHERIANGLTSLFAERRRSDVRKVGADAWNALTAYVRGVAIVGFVDAVLIGLALVIVGVPAAVPLAIITFFGAFFPLIGAVVAGALAALVALVTEGFVAALIIVAVTIVVQQVEGDVLQPIVLGRSVQLHPLVILLSLTAGAIVAGLAGAFVAVPLAAVASVIARHVRSRRDAPLQVPA